MKNKKKRFKVLTSFIVVMAMVITMIPPVPALANSSTSDEILFSKGNQTIEKVYQGGNGKGALEFNFNNDTNAVQFMKLSIDIKGDFSGMIAPAQDGLYNYTLKVQEDLRSCKGSYEQSIKPGEVKNIKLTFSPTFKGEYVITFKLDGITVGEADPEVTPGGGDNPSTGDIPVENHDRNNPTPVINGQNYVILSAGSNYFVIDTPNAIAVKAEVNSSVDLSRMDQYGSFMKINNPNEVFYLKAGKNVFETRTGPFNIGSVKFIYEDYDFGKAEVKWAVPVNKLQAGVEYSFTVNYVPGKNFGQPNDSQLAGVTSINDADIEDGQNVVNGVHKFTAPGVQEFKIRYANKFTNIRNQDVTKTDTIKYTVLPKALGVARSCKGTHNSLTFGIPKDFDLIGATSRVHGDVLILQKKVGGKWVNVVTKDVKNLGSTVTAYKLKGNTSYTFRFMGKVNGKNGQTALFTPAGKNFTRKTAPSTKPVISSVKVYNAKTWKTERKWVPGHWVGTTRYPGFWREGEWRTSYKIKVTLKKSIPGMNGVIVNGNAVKGKGKTFVVSTYSGGKVKGKNLKVRVRAYGSTQAIVGPYSAYKTVKIK